MCLQLAIDAIAASAALEAKLMRAIETEFLQCIGGLLLSVVIHFDSHGLSPTLVDMFAVRAEETSSIPESSGQTAKAIGY
jgi:hypothetical protein